jgi:hypothetical protein
VEKTLARRAWKSLRDSHFPTATTTNSGYILDVSTDPAKVTFLNGLIRTTYRAIDDFVIEIIDLYSATGESAELRFKDTTFLSLEIDFASKRTCADAFDGAECRSESPWKKALADANPYDSLASYLHFRFSLVPKGGSLNLLAVDFELQKL